MAAGAAVLADALLELARYSDDAARWVDRLTLAPGELVRQFKSRLDGFSNPNRCHDWRSVPVFVRQLEGLLQDLRHAAPEPRTGIGLVTDFFTAGPDILEWVHDDDDNVSGVFRHDACELFAEYAAACADKEAVTAAVLALVGRDEHDLRTPLLGRAAGFLPGTQLRAMVTVIQSWREKAHDPHERLRCSRMIEMLARQLVDIPLFVETRLAAHETPTASSCYDIARFCLDCGDPGQAAGWLDRIPAESETRIYGLDGLREDLYRALGDREKLLALVRRRFDRQPSLDGLRDVLEITGEEGRAELVDRAADRIVAGEEFRSSDAAFLLEVGKTDMAAAYIVKRSGQLDGAFYGSLTPLARALAAAKHHLAASLVYRALLGSLLERGYAKAYRHGVHYLQELDRMSSRVADWHGFDGHAAFKARLLRDHGRKWSFWEKYRSAGE